MSRPGTECTLRVPAISGLMPGMVLNHGTDFPLSVMRIQSSADRFYREITLQDKHGQIYLVTVLASAEGSEIKFEPE